MTFPALCRGCPADNSLGPFQVRNPCDIREDPGLEFLWTRGTFLCDG